MNIRKIIYLNCGETYEDMHMKLLGLSSCHFIIIFLNIAYTLTILLKLTEKSTKVLGFGIIKLKRIEFFDQ